MKTEPDTHSAETPRHALEKELASIQGQLSKLYSQELFLQQIIENSPIPIAGIDSDLCFFAYSRSYIKTFELEFDSLYGKHVNEVLPDLPDDWREDLKSCLKGNRIGPEKKVLTLPCGKTEHIDRSLLPLKFPSGKTVGVIIIHQITTAQDLVEAALRASEQRYREMVENLNDALYIANPDGVLTYISPVISTITSFLPQELVGTKLIDLVHRSDRDYLISRMSNTGRTDKTQTECRLLQKKNTHCWVRLTVNPRFQDSELVEFSGVITDLTREKQQEQEQARLEELLHRSKQMEAIGTLAGGIAHDLNNILSGIVSYPDLLLLDLPDGDPRKQIIETIKKSGERAAAVVQDLLTLARTGITGTISVNFNQLIEEYLAGTEVELLKNYHPGLRISYEPEKSLLPINGSPSHLKKILTNMIKNSAEAMPNGGILRITTANTYIEELIVHSGRIPEGQYIKVAISDTGVGIETRALERIFEPFYSTKNMSRSGTGLGMAVVWSSVQDHRGFIDIKTDPGQGTEMQLYFPVEPTALQHSPEPADPPLTTEQLTGSGESILLVDDLPEQLEIGTRILEKLGYKVASASSGEEAVAYLEKHHADLVILDMIMEPGQDGLETYEQIIAAAPGQKAVIASGYAETQRVKKALHLGAHQFLRKPYSMSALGEAVRNALSQQRS